jgi:hypothetical protein
VTDETKLRDEVVSLCSLLTLYLCMTGLLTNILSSLKSVLKVPDQERAANNNQGSKDDPSSPSTVPRAHDMPQSTDDALYADAASEIPSSPGWRERRLRNIGASLSDSYLPPEETTALNSSQPQPSYGASDSFAAPSWTFRKPNLPPVHTSIRGRTWGTASLAPLSSLLSPDRRSFPAYLKTLKRQPSAYDSSLVKRLQDDDDHRAEKINGIRVWYSSFQSIDWLHDAVRMAFPQIIKC